MYTVTMITDVTDVTDNDVVVGFCGGFSYLLPVGNRQNILISKAV